MNKENVEKNGNEQEKQEYTMIWKECIESFFIEDHLKCANPVCGRIPTHYCFVKQNGNEVGNMTFCK